MIAEDLLNTALAGLSSLPLEEADGLIEAFSPEAVTYLIEALKADGETLCWLYGTTPA